MTLRTRLLAAVAVVALLAILVTGAATYSALRSSLAAQVDQGLESSWVPIANAYFNDGQLPDPVMVGRLAPGLFVQLRAPSGAVLETVEAQSFGGAASEPALPARITLPRSGSEYFTAGSVLSNGPPFQVLAVELPDGSQLIVGQVLTQMDAVLAQLVGIEAVVAAIALAAALALGWWLVGLGLAPLRRMERTAAAIAGGQLEERMVDDDAPTEVARLARSFNIMLDRIQDAFYRRDLTESSLRASEERLRRFVADASHELRTPVAAVAAYAELFERGASEHPEDLARILTGIRTETGRMSRLVTDLLLLARLDEGRPLDVLPVELVSLAAEACETARTLGAEWPVELSAERPVETMGDASRLRQVLDNLLGNVRAHTPPGTVTRVRVTQEDGRAVIQVSDNGPGLTPEQQPRIFERFFRADPSRSRTHGGAGLGLAIVAAIVGAHHGTVSVESIPGVGTTFTVRLPILDSAH